MLSVSCSKKTGDCPRDHHPDEHGDDREVCLACRIGRRSESESSCRQRMQTLRLPWRRCMGRHNETVIADADMSQVAAWLLDDTPKPSSPRNATHREPERMVPRREPAVPLLRQPPMNPAPPE